MTVEFQDSKEKQRIREELWKPVIESVFQNTKNIKYLTLPGPECFDIIKFLDLKLLKITNVVSIEKESEFADKIKQFYAKEVGMDTTSISDNIYHDRIENIIKNKNFWERWKNFHIINLDLYGCPFDIGADNESRIFNLFDDVVKRQSKEHYIFVTAKLDAPPKIGMKHQPTMKVIVDEILSPMLELTADKTLQDRIIKRYTNKAELLKIYAVILNMIHQSERIASISLISPPYTYVGLSAKRTTRMLAYIVKVTYSGERPMTPKKRNQRTKKLLSSAISLIEKTVWVN